jgi:hypothetical protein
MRGVRQILLQTWLANVTTTPPTVEDMLRGSRKSSDRRGLGWEEPTTKGRDRRRTVPFIKTVILKPDRTAERNYSGQEIMDKIEESRRWLAGELILPEIIPAKLTKQEDIYQYVIALLSGASAARVPIAYVAYIWYKDYRPSPIVEMYLEEQGPRSVMQDGGAGMSLISREWFGGICAKLDRQKKYARYYGPAWGMGGMN